MGKGKSNFSLWQQEDERVRLQGHRGGLELQGLQSHEVSWAQERAALQQEVRLFRRNTVVLYMKLRSMLMRRRLGCRDQEEAAQPEVGHRSPGDGGGFTDRWCTRVHRGGCILHIFTTVFPHYSFSIQYFPKSCTPLCFPLSSCWK